MELLDYLPTMSPSQYGTAVHGAFALALWWQDLPGVGDIERSFSLDTLDPYYGMAGTIRTDATLRNVQGDVIAIYDVKPATQEYRQQGRTNCASGPALRRVRRFSS